MNDTNTPHIFPAGLYRHYKGGLYQVLGIGQHTETKEYMVVYVALDGTLLGPRIRIRPLNGHQGWNEPVGMLENTNTLISRFVYVGVSL